MVKKLSFILAASVSFASTGWVWADELSEIAAEEVIIPSLDSSVWRADYQLDLPPKKLQALRESGQLDGESMLSNERIEGYSLTEWVTGEETVQDWTKLVVAQFFEGVQEPIESFAFSFAQQLQASCPAVHLEMLERDAKSVLLEWDTRDCEYLGVQHELTRFIAGEQGWHRISYKEMKPQMDEDTRNQWLIWLKEAKIQDKRALAESEAEKTEANIEKSPE